MIKSNLFKTRNIEKYLHYWNQTKLLYEKVIDLFKDQM